MDDTVLYTRKRRDASGVRVTPPPPRLKLLVGSVGVSTSIIFASELEGAVGKSLPSTGAQYKQISGHKPTISSSSTNPTLACQGILQKQGVLHKIII